MLYKISIDFIRFFKNYQKLGSKTTSKTGSKTGPGPPPGGAQNGPKTGGCGGGCGVARPPTFFFHSTAFSRSRAQI